MNDNIKNNPTLIIYGDGGSRGNPGEAAFGYVIYDKGKRIIHEKGKRIGVTTNNVAEYTAVVEALKWIEKNMKDEVNELHFFLDSQLVASQLSGIFKVKHPNMRALFTDVKQIETRLNLKISYNSIPREMNREADRLVNEALDGKI